MEEIEEIRYCPRDGSPLETVLYSGPDGERREWRECPICSYKVEVPTTGRLVSIR